MFSIHTHLRRRIFMSFAKTAMLSFAILLAFVFQVSAQSAKAAPAQIARGKYLVEGVAKCGDCHSPMDDKGQPIAGKEFHGQTLPFKPSVPMPVWADKAPNIAGLRGWEEADAVKFLMTGIAYNDLPARPPMPQYRMNKEDAQAVVAFLKSLSPVAK
jgi:mono/diheme cytochrome c family protein